ncbi:MAG: hypothetical protein PVJ28_12050 [Acidimicrobiia bacterium]
MEPTLDQVRKELADASLPTAAPDHFGRSAQLKHRQNELPRLSSRSTQGQPVHDRASG